MTDATTVILKQRRGKSHPRRKFKVVAALGINSAVSEMSGVEHYQTNEESEEEQGLVTQPHRVYTPQEV